jgi:N-acetylmuramoyl-L-alanine amidase
MRLTPGFKLTAWTAALCLLASVWAAAEQVTVIDAKGRTTVLSALQFEGHPYLPLAGLTGPWEATGTWSELTGRAEVKMPGHSLTLSADNTFCQIDGKSYNLYYPVRHYQGELWVPMELFQRYLIPLWGRTVSYDDKTKRLSLGGFQASAPTPPAAAKSSNIIEQRAIRKVVVDPGHGGKDPGAVGPTGLKEKDVNLEIGLRLKAILEDMGLLVVMTRDDDTFIPLSGRTDLANREAADIFISVHCNAAPWKKRARKTMKGSETYFLSLAKTDDARATAAMENAAIQFEQPDDKTKNLDEVQFILWDMVQNQYLTESADLAEYVQEALGSSLPFPSRGVSQAGFYVLNGAYMPAILVESAFISHKDEEKLLKQSDTKRKIAQAIAKGLAAFARRHQMKLGEK